MATVSAKSASTAAFVSSVTATASKTISSGPISKREEALSARVGARRARALKRDHQAIPRPLRIAITRTVFGTYTLYTGYATVKPRAQMRAGTDVIAAVHFGCARVHARTGSRKSRAPDRTRARAIIRTRKPSDQATVPSHKPTMNVSIDVSRTAGHTWCA